MLEDELVEGTHSPWVAVGSSESLVETKSLDGLQGQRSVEELLFLQSVGVWEGTEERGLLVLPPTKEARRVGKAEFSGVLRLSKATLVEVQQLLHPYAAQVLQRYSSSAPGQSQYLFQRVYLLPALFSAQTSQRDLNIVPA